MERMLDKIKNRFDLRMINTSELNKAKSFNDLARALIKADTYFYPAYKYQKAFSVERELKRMGLDMIGARAVIIAMAENAKGLTSPL